MKALTPLSELLGGFFLSGQTWCYADLGSGGGYSLPPANAVWFHAVLHGSLRIASPASGTLEIKAGEMLAVLSGEAHALRVTSDAQAVSLDFLREGHTVDAPPTFPLGKPGPVIARVLSGRLALELPPQAARQSLPGFVRLGNADQSAWGQLIRPEALALAGIGPGSAALLTRLAATILTAHLRADPAARAMFSAADRGQSFRAVERRAAGAFGRHGAIELCRPFHPAGGPRADGGGG